MKSWFQLNLRFVLVLLATALVGCSNGSLQSETSLKKRDSNFIRFELTRQKVNLNEPVLFGYYLELPSEAAAEKVRPLLREQGYQVSIEKPDKGSRWHCSARQSFVPAQDSPEMRYFALKRLAQAHGGNLFTWWAETPKKP